MYAVLSVGRVEFKKAREDYSGLLFSTGQTREDYYSGLLFSSEQSPLKKKHVKTTYSGLLSSTAVRFVWRIAPKTPHDYDSRPTLGGFRRPLCLLGVCGLVNQLHLPFECFPYTPLLRRGVVLTRQEHDLTILLGNSFGERGARTTTSSLVFRGAEV